MPKALRVFALAALCAATLLAPLGADAGAWDQTPDDPVMLVMDNPAPACAIDCGEEVAVPEGTTAEHLQVMAIIDDGTRANARQVAGADLAHEGVLTDWKHYGASTRGGSSRALGHDGRGVHGDGIRPGPA